MANLPPGSPPTTLSIHRDVLENASPAWLINATPERRAQLKAAPAQPPDWYLRASPAQQQALNAKYTTSFTAQTVLDKTMARLQDIDTFAQPLLVKALQEQFNVQLDVNKTLVQLRTRVEYLQPQATYGTFEVLRLPLLQAALHNFEASECKEGAFDASSGFVTEASEADKFDAVTTSLTVAQFTTLCRSLDIGAQYQRYLKDFVSPKDPVADQVLRQKFIAARKAELAVAAEQALLTKDIGADDYQMIVSVINGENHPWMGTRQVWFSDLGLMRKRMTGCVAFVICEIRRYTNDLILYIPQDPYHPLKRVTYDQMQTIFKERFTTRDTSAPDDGRPTAYQDFFSRFVRYADLPTYFGELTTVTPAPGALVGLKLYSPFLIHFLRGISPFKTIEATSDPEPIKRLNADPFLDVVTRNQKGRIGWEDNLDLWDYLYDQHRDKLLADAASHAVATADVDARVRSEKIANLLGIGFLALNVVSMFVPVLGEVMMGVMAGQLLYETLEGSIEWAEGDRRAAKAHLVDVAENLAFLALMAGGAKVIGKLTAAKPAPVIEALDPVTLPNGETRLWKPDLKGYESPVNLPADAVPNAQGQYRHEGKTYIRQAGKVYEKTFDDTLNRWRIKHPTDPAAYQPPLVYNGNGAWRHTLERPLTWDRLTLMQRMGPVTAGFDELQLLQIADISGVSDNALRKMHLDNAPPPAPLEDALRLFKADADVAQVIEQVSSGQAVDGRYLYALPLVTELPRWPQGRVLEIFDDPALTGPSVRYGTERLFRGVKFKPTIPISRADVLSSRLPTRIIAALDESEIVGLLGGEPARVVENRPLELRKQLADYARTRQPALFESLYKGTGVPDPTVAKLQRLYPGLSEPAAKSVVAEADAEQLRRLHHAGRVPLAMQEHARWHVREGRVSRAYAGLHMENMASADSKRLALHTLSELPGWSNQVRLEVRDGSIEGPLLDSIGSETASQRKYLVKKGAVYQAFNERGEALNSLPRHGDNFYASVMQALPDEARRSLGLPHVSQSAQLRRAIIDYVADHPRASAQSVEGQTQQQPWFKPPRRISPTRLGYPASGGAEGLSPSLVSRVRDVYPGMTDEQANTFILRQFRDNRTQAQIFNLLDNRLREWQQLEATLDAWVATESPLAHIRRYPALDSRPDMALELKTSWRNAPLADFPGRSSLRLDIEPPLPPLLADFSHVRTLSLSGPSLIEWQFERLREYFPNVQKLTLSGADTSSSSVLLALEGMSHLTSLTIESDAELTEQALTRLEGLTQLEALCLITNGAVARPLNVRRLNKLRTLRLAGFGQRVFPVGLWELPELQQLDFNHSQIDQLPPELFEPGRERWWSRLSLQWRRINREHFKSAYDYVRNHSEHLVDQDEMVQDYCYGQLQEQFGRGRYGSRDDSGELEARFFERWRTTPERYDAIEALNTEYDDVSRRLHAWRYEEPWRHDDFDRSRLHNALDSCWVDGMRQRYGFSQSPPLNLSGLSLIDLPVLHPDGFAHVTWLQLEGLRILSHQLSQFMRGFSGLRRLDASNCDLTELSLAPGEWPALEHLDLSRNPLSTLDISGLTNLQSLSVTRSGLRTWPTGVENLPDLTSLNLADTLIARLPASALANDRMVLDTRLTGALLNPEAKAALAQARQRIELESGLPEGSLERFDQQSAGAQYPSEESGSSIARHLLPLLPADPLEGALSLPQRLQRLHPALGEEGAAQWLERLQGEGLKESQVGERIRGWEQTFDALTRRLNGWLYIRQQTISPDLGFSSSTRQLASQRIIDCWRNGLAPTAEGAGSELSFHGLVLGDLPELPTDFPHVNVLNLNGVHFSEQASNAFLTAFPQVRTLTLSGNPLGALPEAVQGMDELRQLALSAIEIVEPEQWYSALQRIEHLQVLDMSDCELATARVEGFLQLQTLDLSENDLVEWPDGVFLAPLLTTLDLSGNRLQFIPSGALEGAHDRLMEGTDLSYNVHLPLDDLYRLQAYAERTGRTSALGFTDVYVQQMINDIQHPYVRESDSDSDTSDEARALPDEDLPQAQDSEVLRRPWFHNLTPDDAPRKRVLWDELQAEPGSTAFFNLLSLLPLTKDFDVVRASLTHRVWEVIEAAGSNAELRETLFAMSASHSTCSDGRILIFSTLEIKVYEFKALEGQDHTNLAVKGPALLNLSRRLFRLEEVEKLAASKMTAHSDGAEVRLQYLIGLREELDLPGLPQFMRYANPIEGVAMQTAADTIKKAETTDVFYLNLISRDYWVDYLGEQYPQELSALDRSREEKTERLESQHTELNEAYGVAVTNLEVELSLERRLKLIELSRREAAVAADEA